MSAAVCSRCERRPSELTRGMTPLCGPCWAEWRADIVGRLGGEVDRGGVIDGKHVVWRDGGGVQVGGARPDHGPDQVELGCPLCEATWIGALGDSCPWCDRRTAQLVAEQRSLLLAGPVERDDESLRLWAHRLADAVKAGILELDDARRAWRRELRHAA